MQKFDEDGVRVQILLPDSIVEKNNSEILDLSDQGSTLTPPAHKDILAGNVLILDDDFLIARHNQEIAKSLGATQCFLAGRTTAALDILSQHSMDFAILDINLDGEYSIAVAERLTECNCPFVFVTGYDSGEFTLHEFRHIPVVRKPILSLIHI